MENNINSCFMYIMTYAKKILTLKDKLETNITNSEKKEINSEIDTYKSYIDQYTDNSSEFILIYAQKIRCAKQKLHEENDESKRDILEFGLRAYEDSIKSHITIDSKKNKSSKFRNSQKATKATTTINDDIMELIEICNTHHAELKEQEKLKKESSDKEI